MKNYYIDVHAHLDDDEFNEDIVEVITHASNESVKKIITIGSDLKTSKKNLEIANKYENIYCAIGVHPHESKYYSEETENELKKMANDKKVVAIGEIGLDYHYMFSSKEEQILAFKKQLILANDLNLPIQIHTREATGDLLSILKENKSLLNNGGVIHCFNESVETARELRKLGFGFSIGGVLTFTNAKNLIRVVSELPKECFMLETDCPWLSPVPFRGRRNEPKNVAVVAKTFSVLWGCSLDEVAEITTNNARNMFKRLEND